MFVHVPCAWLSMFIYALIAMSSFGLLVFRHPLADVSAKAAAPLGAAFTLLALVTGSLSGEPISRTLLGVGPAPHFRAYPLPALPRPDRAALVDGGRGAGRQADRLFSLVGIAILPVIKFSVNSNSLHQPASVMRFGAPTIHPSLLWPLLVMAVGMTVLFAALHVKAMRNEILRRRVKAMRVVEVAASGGLAHQAAE